MSSTKLNEKSINRISYELNALIQKMKRSAHLRATKKTETPAYRNCLESIKKTKALLHKIRKSLNDRRLKAALEPKKSPADSVENVARKLREFAQANYTKGWDFIVECYGPGELEARLTEHKLFTFRAAKKHFSQFVEVRNDIAQDHQLEAASGA